jgi:N-acylneuraminate cytidylyltransferase
MDKCGAVMDKYEKACAIIPARSGSKSIDHKNMQKIGKWPLLAWAVAAAKKAKLINRIIVSTDSLKYGHTIQTIFPEVEVFIRPEKISKDDSTDAEWVQHIIHTVDTQAVLPLPEYLVHLRPTSPLRHPKYIDAAIYWLQINTQATALRSVCEMSQSVHKHFYIEEGYLKSIGLNTFELDKANKPRHTYPTSYDANGYVDILRTSHIRATGLVHGNLVIPWYVPKITDIDTMDDLNYARWEYEQNSKKYDGLFGEE